jgi:nucleotide-binding universal stress UspA family protein
MIGENAATQQRILFRVGYDRVLVTLDGSKFAEVVLEHAIKAANSGANVHILPAVAQDAISEIASMVSAVAQPISASASWRKRSIWRARFERQPPAARLRDG